MGWFDHDHKTAKAYSTVDTVLPHEHKAKLSHELIGGAAAFEAAKAYQDHCERNGKPESHAKAKELFAGFAGVAVDRLIETKGLSFIDKEKAKHQAKQHGEEVMAKEYQP